jgi:hypothetical protein
MESLPSVERPLAMMISTGFSYGLLWLGFCVFSFVMFISVALFVTQAAGVVYIG